MLQIMLGDLYDKAFVPPWVLGPAFHIHSP